MRSLGFALLALCAPSAAAEPLPEHARRDHGHPPAGFGGSAVFGWADDGWVARLEYELFPVMTPHGTFGPLLGFTGGGEYWRDGNDRGFAMPVLWAGGVKLHPMRALLGVGMHALTIDSVNGDAGFGLFAPVAMASIGFDVWGVRVGIDARASRHWQFGADDFTQLQLAVSVGYTMSTVKRGTKPYY